jgi:hypothetical protein
MEETLKVADRIIEITKKTKDHIQQWTDYLFVSEVFFFVDKLETFTRIYFFTSFFFHPQSFT